MTLISVIVPVYNGENTIAQTIESVLSQKHSQLELIVINDGSTDKTVSIVDSFTDVRIRLISHPNQGTSASRNRGIREAIGQYLAFLDADDLWTSDKLADQLKALENCPEAGLAYSWTDQIDTDGKFLRPGLHMSVDNNPLNSLFLRNFIESGSNALIRSSVFKTVGNFNEKVKYVEDWEMWLRIAAKYDFVCVPKPQVFYRIYPGSMSCNVAQAEKHLMHVMEQALALHPDIGPVVRKKAYADRYRYLALKAVNNGPILQNKRLALRCFINSLRYEPVWWLSRGQNTMIFLLRLLFNPFLNQLIATQKAISVR
ncbi:MAG: glycosyltransferase [Cyanobacteria bacterium P01_D01_bin.156]